MTINDGSNIYPQESDFDFLREFDNFLPDKQEGVDVLGELLFQGDNTQTDSSKHQEVTWDHHKQVQPIEELSIFNGEQSPMSLLFQGLFDPQIDHQKEEQHRQAREIYEKANQAFRSAKNPDGSLNRLNCLSAQASLHQAIDLDNTFADAHYLLGSVNLNLSFYYLSEFEKVKNAYPHADPESTDPHDAQVIAKLDEHQNMCIKYCTQAKMCFQEAIKHNPSLKLDGLRQIGHCYSTMGNSDNAIDIFSELLLETPENQKLNFYRGQLLYKTARYKEAIQDFEALKGNSIYAPTAFYYLTKIYLKLKDNDNIKKHLLMHMQAFYNAYEEKNLLVMKKIASKVLMYNAEEYFPGKYFILGATKMRMGERDEAEKYFKTFFDWHFSNADSEHRCDDKQINKVLQLYLEIQVKKNHTDDELEELRLLLVNIEKITTFHSRTANFFMAEIHNKANKMEHAFHYYEVANILNKKLVNQSEPLALQKLHEVTQKVFEQVGLLDQSEGVTFEEKDQRLFKCIELQERLLNQHEETKGETVSSLTIPSISLSAVDDLPDSAIIPTLPSSITPIETTVSVSNASEKSFVVGAYSYLLDQLNMILHESFDHVSEDLFFYYEHIRMSRDHMLSYPIHTSAIVKLIHKIRVISSNFTQDKEKKVFNSIIDHFFSNACCLVSYQGITPNTHGMKTTLQKISGGNQLFYEELQLLPKNLRELIKSKIRFHKDSHFISNKGVLGSSSKLRRYAFYAFISLNHLQLDWRKNNTAKWLQNPDSVRFKHTAINMFCISPRNTFETIAYPIVTYYDHKGWLQKVDAVSGEDRKLLLSRLEQTIPDECWNHSVVGNGNVIRTVKLPQVSAYMKSVASDKQAFSNSFVPLLVSEGTKKDSEPVPEDSIEHFANNTGLTLNRTLEAIEYCVTNGSMRPTPKDSWVNTSSASSRKRTLEGDRIDRDSGKRQKSHQF